MAKFDKTDSLMSAGTCVYFPFTSIKALTLKDLSSCFRRIVLYQPVGAGPPADLETWVETGLLELRTPLEGITDKEVLLDRLKHWKAWIRSTDQQDLAYLKAMKDRIGPAHPTTPNLISEIKAADHTKQEQGDGDEISHQLFLLLSQEWENQSMDLRKHLQSVQRQYQSLQSFLRTDGVEEEKMPVVDPLLTEKEEDRGAVLTKKYLAAWNHLFQKDPVPPSIFLTDSPAVFAELLEDIPDTVEIPLSPQIVHDDYLGGPLPKLLMNEWDKNLEDMVAKIRKETGPNGERGSGRPALELRLIPDVSPTTFFNNRVGVQVGAGQSCAHTILGLWPAR